MKGICFEGIERVAVRELPDPEIEDPGDVLVQVSLAGLCGSDLHPFFGRESGLDPGTVMGHELVGRVIAVGSGVRNLVAGDRVFAPFSTSCGDCFYCNRGLTSRCPRGQLFGWRAGGIGLHGCQAEQVRVPLAEGTLMKLPEGVSDESALLLGDNFSTGFYCAEMAGVRSGEVYAVVGCGTVGQLAIVAALASGADHVVAVDLDPARREAAARLGADACGPEEVEQRVRDLTEGRGADAVMELVGLPAAQHLAFRLMRPGGILSVIGCHCTPDFAFSPVDAYDRNLTYRTGRCPARAYMEKLTPRVAAGEFSLDHLITHRFGIEDGVEAYDVFAGRRDGCVKAVIDFGD